MEMTREYVAWVAKVWKMLDEKNKREIQECVICGAKYDSELHQKNCKVS